MSARVARLWVAAGLIGVTLVSLHPVFHAGLWFSDEEQHWPRRISEFVAALEAGQLWPRWAPNLAAGFGYPFPHFYAPGPMWIGALGFLATGSYLLSVKFAYVIPALLAGWGMYRFLRPGVSRPAAFTGAMLYHLAPYHALNIFVRGNLAEYLAMGLFPWALWGLRRLTERRRGRDLALAACLIGTYQLSHTLSAVFGTGILLVWAMLDSLTARQDKLHVGFIRLAAFGLGTMLTTLFWLPVAVDSSETRVAEVGTSIVAAEHVVTFPQLLWSDWGYGYSYPLDHPDPDGMSLQLGPLQWLALLVGLTALARPITRRRLLPWLVLTVALILVMLPLSQPLWGLPVTRMLQFPWRLLAFAVAGCAVLGAWGLQHLIGNRTPPVWDAVMGCALAGLFFCRVEGHNEEMPDEAYAPEITRQIPTTTTANEYMPSEATQPLQFVSRWGLVSTRPDTVIEPLEISAFARSWRVTVPRADVLLVETTFFPTWSFASDLEGRIAPGVHTTGAMALPLGPGEHTVTQRWRATRVHRAAEWVSLLAVLILLALAALPRFNPRPTSPAPEDAHA